MSTITYSRQHVASELDRIHEIKRAALRPRYRWAKSTLAEVTKKHGAWTACHSGKVVGYLLAWPQGRRRYHIAGVVVHKRFQGQGIGAKLISLAERHYRRRGCTQASLNVDINNSAQLLYLPTGISHFPASQKAQLYNHDQKTEAEQMRVFHREVTTVYGKTVFYIYSSHSYSGEYGEMLRFTTEARGDVEEYKNRVKEEFQQRGYAEVEVI